MERLLFLDTLCSTLRNCCTEEFLFLGGDFNCAELDIVRNHVEPHMASRKVHVKGVGVDGTEGGAF